MRWPSTGSGRGVIYTAQDFTRYRILFTMRHVSGSPDHQACVLVFCTRPQANEKPPRRPRRMPVPGPERRPLGLPARTKQQRHQLHHHHQNSLRLSSMESRRLLVDATKGTARMAVAQPLGSKAVEVLSFNNAAAGRPVPSLSRCITPVSSTSTKTSSSNPTRKTTT